MLEEEGQRESDHEQTDRQERPEHRLECRAYRVRRLNGRRGPGRGRYKTRRDDALLMRQQGGECALELRRAEGSKLRVELRIGHVVVDQRSPGRETRAHRDAAMLCRPAGLRLADPTR